MATLVQVGDLSSTSPGTRLRRFTTAEAAISMGVIIGFLTGGVITTTLGSIYVFLLCSLLSLLSIIYCLVRVKNILPDSSDEPSSSGPLSRLLRTLRLPFLPRRCGGRAIVLLLCAASLLGVTPLLLLLQEMPWVWQDTVMVLWATRLFHWGAQTLLNFKVPLSRPPCQAFFWLLYNGSQLVALPLLSRLLPGMTIAALSSVSRAAYFGILAVATSPDLLYLAAGLNALSGTQGILIRLAWSPLLLGQVWPGSRPAAL